MPLSKKNHYLWIPFMMLGVTFLAAWIVMLLWNAIIPEVVGFKPLHYGQALGLLVLCRLLFGNFPQGRKHHHAHQHHAHQHHESHIQMREKWKEMSEEERMKFKDEWRKKCKTKNT